jgi:DNA (cytosine-5)-methyltransferase 1
MIDTGPSLRKFREQQNLSQARLAELACVPQHQISSFELERTPLADDYLKKIIAVIADLSAHESVITRKKRYREHSYNGVVYDHSRAASAALSDGNVRYREAISTLSETPSPKFTGLSLFSGCGGFSLGFRSAGCNIKGFVEIDDGLSKIYQSNFTDTPRIGSDITKLDSDTISNFCKNSGEIDIIIGGPPCQGFSLSGKRDAQDPRNYLFQDYMRVLDIVRPKVAVIENVRLLTSMKSKTGGFVKDQIISDLRNHGYDASYFEVNACNHGIPQHRERVFFIAIRNDLDITPSFPSPEFDINSGLFEQNHRFRTFADACSDLQFLESGQESADPLHRAVKHPDHVIKWLWDVPQGASAHDNDDPELRPPSGYNTTYKRQIWQEPGSTVQTTFGMISGCRNVHPIATRSLTIREAARLQSFPDTYSFVGSLGTIRTGIGNAVPPLLARRLALHVRAAILDLVKISSL